MPNRFTAVPPGRVPPPARGMGPLLAVADVFMALMLSRPGGLSLRTTWVTPGTLLLTGLCTPVSALLAVSLILRGGPWWLLGAVLILVVGTGSAAVATVGLVQRRIRG